MNKRMKVLKRLTLSTLTSLATTGLFVKPSFASGIISKASSFVQPSGTPPITVSQAASDLAPVTNILFTIATTVIVITGLILGVKYMMSEPNDKSKIKEKVIWYFIAIVLVYSGIGIAQLVANFITKNFAG